jgi:hypothetical protein
MPSATNAKRTGAVPVPALCPPRPCGLPAPKMRLGDAHANGEQTTLAPTRRRDSGCLGPPYGKPQAIDDSPWYHLPIFDEWLRSEGAP